MSEPSIETVSVTKARNELGIIINKARFAGTPTVVTKQGKPVAAIVPLKPEDFSAGMTKRELLERLT